MLRRPSRPAETPRSPPIHLVYDARRRGLVQGARVRRVGHITYDGGGRRFGRSLAQRDVVDRLAVDLFHVRVAGGWPGGSTVGSDAYVVGQARSYCRLLPADVVAVNAEDCSGGDEEDAGEGDADASAGSGGEEGVFGRGGGGGSSHGCGRVCGWGSGRGVPGGGGGGEGGGWDDGEGVVHA
jgi:hypothetical protein